MSAAAAVKPQASIHESGPTDYPSASTADKIAGRSLDQKKFPLQARALAATASAPVAIIDPNALFRAGIVATLAESRFRVIAACSAFNDLTDKMVERCRLVVLSIEEPEQLTLSQIASLSERGIRVVLLGERPDPKEVFAALAAGAD